VYKLGSRLNESLGGLRQYSYRYLNTLLKSRFAVRLSESPSAQGQRSRGSLALVYARAAGGRGAQIGVSSVRSYGYVVLAETVL